MITEKSFLDELRNKYGDIEIQDLEPEPIRKEHRNIEPQYIRSKLIKINSIPNVTILANYPSADDSNYKLMSVTIEGTTNFEEWMNLNAFERWIKKELEKYQWNLKLSKSGDETRKIEVYQYTESAGPEEMDELYDNIAIVSQADKELSEAAKEISNVSGAIQTEITYKCIKKETPIEPIFDNILQQIKTS